MKYALRKLFYGLLYRFFVMLLFIAVVPLVLVRLLLYLAPAHLSSIDPVIVASIGASILLVGVYALLRYEKLEKQMQLFSNLAEIGEIAAQVAHDLRAPLAAMKVAATVFGSKTISGDHERLLHMSIDRVEGVAQDLLHRYLGSSENFKESDLQQTLDSVIAEFSMQPLLENVRFKRSYCKPTLHLQMQKNRMERAICNLFRNAIEAMEFSGTILITTDRDGNSIRMRIHDSGPGMPPEKMEEIMSETAVISSEKESGHGIGLKFVKTVVADHQGKMSMSSFPGRGTEFV